MDSIEAHSTIKGHSLESREHRHFFFLHVHSSSLSDRDEVGRTKLKQFRPTHTLSPFSPAKGREAPHSEISPGLSLSSRSNSVCETEATMSSSLVSFSAHVVTSLLLVPSLFPPCVELSKNWPLSLRVCVCCICTRERVCLCLHMQQGYTSNNSDGLCYN